MGVLVGGLVPLFVPAAAAAASAPAGTAAVPRPDHVVIVVEENRADSKIVGSPDAPFITALAADNADFTQSYAETHPSQPNYLALFSGSFNGITDDSCPHTLTGPNLGDELAAAGLSFAAYSEDLPSVGYTGCTSGKYVRRHAPWVNFPSIPAAAHQPLTAFPTDYSTLPAVTFVIPNLDNDMHDGSIARGDAWLQAHLGGYIGWAKTHNSLFALTFDEDDGSDNNRIATVLAGERVVPGSYSDRIDHYSLLRTIQDAYGLAPIGNSVPADPILSVWSPPAGDQVPVARMTVDCSGQHCAVDGSASGDPDGSIVDYAWNFGDGGTAHGTTATHDYATAGSYPIRLVVTDNAGAATSTTQTVPAAAPSAPFVRDTFQRTVASGLGSADAGGPWTVLGSAANTSVQPGAAAFNVPAGVTTGGYLASGARSDTDITATMTPNLAVTGTGLYLTEIGRRVASNEYRAQLRISASNAVSLRIIRLSGGAETTLTSGYTLPGVTYRAGMGLTIRFQAVGTNPTTLRARAWAKGSAEPSGWPAATSDSVAALQVAGAVGAFAYLSRTATTTPLTVALSDLTARPTAGSTTQPPTASVATSCTGLTCSADGTASTDPDGTIRSYAWDFGDGATAATATASHTYAAGGTYPVLLSVVDDAGASAARSRLVTVAASNGQPPVAAFTATPTYLTASFDPSGSSDPDGSITGYAWTFGDGATSIAAAPSHTYALAGTYGVTLTVTDDQGLTGTTSGSVTVTQPPDQPPVASFTATPTDLTVAFDSSGSSDPDGRITGYAWTFGDGATSTAASPSHTYPASGTYTATLTVTDDRAVSASTSRSVTVSAPLETTYGTDTFTRTTATGSWGSADVGGAWTLSSGSSQFTVTGTTGRIRMPAGGSPTLALLSTIRQADTDTAIDCTLAALPNGSGGYISVLARRAGTSDYRLRARYTADGKIRLFVSSLVSNHETVLRSVTLPETYRAGDAFRLRFRVSGSAPSTLRGSMWKVGTAEPATPQISFTDATAALQGTGVVGLSTYLSSAATNGPVDVLFDNLSIVRPN